MGFTQPALYKHLSIYINLWDKVLKFSLIDARCQYFVELYSMEIILYKIQLLLPTTLWYMKSGGRRRSIVYLYIYCFSIIHDLRSFKQRNHLLNISLKKDILIHVCSSWKCLKPWFSECEKIDDNNHFDSINVTKSNQVCIKFNGSTTI